MPHSIPSRDWLGMLGDIAPAGDAETKERTDMNPQFYHLIGGPHDNIYATSVAMDTVNGSLIALQCLRIDLGIPRERYEVTHHEVFPTWHGNRKDVRIFEVVANGRKLFSAGEEYALRDNRSSEACGWISAVTIDEDY